MWQHLEHKCGCAAPAEREHGVPEAAAALGHGVRVLQADLLKSAECVR